MYPCLIWGQNVEVGLSLQFAHGEDVELLYGAPPHLHHYKHHSLPLGPVVNMIIDFYLHDGTQYFRRR